MENAVAATTTTRTATPAIHNTILFAWARIEFIIHKKNLWANKFFCINISFSELK